MPQPNSALQLPGSPVTGLVCADRLRYWHGAAPRPAPWAQRALPPKLNAALGLRDGTCNREVSLTVSSWNLGEIDGLA